MTRRPESFLIDGDARSIEVHSRQRMEQRKNVALAIGGVLLVAVVAIAILAPWFSARERPGGSKQPSPNPDDNSGWQDSSIFTESHKMVLAKTLSRLDLLLNNTNANESYILHGVEGRDQIPDNFPGTPLFAIGGAQQVHKLYGLTRIQDSHFRYINLLVLLYLQEIGSSESSTCAGLRQFLEKMLPGENVKELSALNRLLQDRNFGLEFGSEADAKQKIKLKSDVVKSKMLAGRDLNKVFKPFKAIVSKFGSFDEYLSFYKFYTQVFLRDVASLTAAAECLSEKVRRLEDAIDRCYNALDGMVLLYPAAASGLPIYAEAEQRLQVKQLHGELFHPSLEGKILVQNGNVIDVSGKSYMDPRKLHFLIHYVPTLWGKAWQAQVRDGVLVDGGGPSSAIPLLFKLLHVDQEQMTCRFDRAGFVYPMRSGQDLHADDLLAANNVPVAQQGLKDCAALENRNALQHTICEDIFQNYVDSFKADFDDVNKLQKLVVYGGGRAAGEVARRRVQHNRKLGRRQVVISVWHRCNAKIDLTMKDWQDMLAETTKDLSALPHLEESARTCLQKLRKQVVKVVEHPASS